MKMKIKILGGGREVGRAGYQISTKQSNVLLDYGIKIEPYGIEYPQRPDVNIDAIVLSHAHMDHSGLIPSLYGKSTPNLYLTTPTLDICDILWRDAMKIARLEDRRPEYNKEQCKIAESKVKKMNYRKPTKIAKDMSLTFYDAGHILGSGMPLLETKEGNVLYTGDFKGDETRLHFGADYDIDKDIGVLMIESTYGDRDHPDRTKIEREFVKSIKKIIDSGGSVLIPSFALGRAQEILGIIAEENFDVPLYLDGMGQKVSNVYLQYPNYFKEAYNLRQAMNKVIKVKTQKQREELVKKQAIIVTTAGMVEGGPVLYYFKKLCRNSDNAIYLTGFQVQETKGDILLKESEIEIDGGLFKWAGEIKKFDFSAHAGRNNLFQVMSAWNPELVVCIHGDDSVMQGYVKKIEEDLGLKAIAPKNGQVIEYHKKK